MKRMPKTALKKLKQQLNNTLTKFAKQYELAASFTTSDIALRGEKLQLKIAGVFEPKSGSQKVSPTIDDNGTKRYYNKRGELHRAGGPAVILSDGTKLWYKNGLKYRLDGPAIEWVDGTKQWYVNGKRHRLDGPAEEWADGTKAWYRDDKLHREDGPAYESIGGVKAWYVNGMPHREDGPAIEWAR